MSAVDEQSPSTHPAVNPYSAAIRRFSVADLTNDPEPSKVIWMGIPDEPGKVSVFAGTGGLGKSALTAGLVTHRALGLNFLARATKAGATIIISKEDSRADYRRKLAAQRVVLGSRFDAEKVAEKVILLDLVGDPAMLVEPRGGGLAAPNADLVQHWADAISAAGTGADLIILETASRLTPSEDNPGLAALVSACELLGRLTGCSVLLVHHTGKENARNGVADSYSGRGGSALADNARAVMVLTSYPKDQKARGRFGLAIPEEMADRVLVLSVPKLNGAPPPQALIIEKVPTPWALTLRAVDREKLDRADDATNRRRVAQGVQEVARLIEAATENGQMVTRRSIEKRQVDGIDARSFPLGVLKAILDEAVRCGALIEVPGSRKGCVALKADSGWFANMAPANDVEDDARSA